MYIVSNSDFGKFLVKKWQNHQKTDLKFIKQVAGAHTGRTVFTFLGTARAHKIKAKKPGNPGGLARLPGKIDLRAYIDRG